MKFQQVHLRLDNDLYEQITEISRKEGDSIAETLREIIKEGLAVKMTENNTDLIANIVRQQLEIVLKPHVERICKLSSKSGHMSATAAFLNVQAFMDLVPTERRKNVKEMYESARKKAAEYMKTKAEDWDNDFNSKD